VQRLIHFPWRQVLTPGTILSKNLSTRTASMLTWSIEKIELPLKYTWKISRNASESKTNILVSVSDGMKAGWGEAAPNIRYEETPEKLWGEFQAHVERLPAEPVTLEALGNILDGLPFSKALRFSLESAYLHYLARVLPSPLPIL